MDWAGWALFGLVATAALTAIMITAQLAGLTRLDLPLLLGTIFTEDPDRARAAGFVANPAARARSGSSVKMVPSSSGRSRRVRPASWAVIMIAVSAAVATRPNSAQPAQ